MANIDLIWDRKMSVGIRQFDEHHKVIVGLIFDMKGKVNSGEQRDYLMKLLYELSSYIKYHFAAEERMLKSHGYPDADMHIQHHRYFTEQINEFEEQMAFGKGGLEKEIYLFLKTWFADHIMKMDKAYSEFLNERGIT